MQSSELASSRPWAPPRALPAPLRASSDRNRSPRRLYGAGYARQPFFSRDACSKSSVFATFALSGLVRAVVRARGALRWRTKRCAPSPGPRRPHWAPFPRPDPCILSRESDARAAAAAARSTPTVVCLAWLAGQGLRARLLLSAPSSESVRWAPCRLARPCPAYRITGVTPALDASLAGCDGQAEVLPRAPPQRRAGRKLGAEIIKHFKQRRCRAGWRLERPLCAGAWPGCRPSSPLLATPPCIVPLSPTPPRACRCLRMGARASGSRARQRGSSARRVQRPSTVRAGRLQWAPGRAVRGEAVFRAV